MLRVDVVVVSYSSRSTLRGCVEPLCTMDAVTVTVVDNDSPDDATATVADLPLRIVHSGRNGGFGFGCNLGAAAGTAPAILLLNPDARIAPDALRTLVALLDREPAVAIVGPRILDEDGRLQHTQRTFARLRSTWSQALFVHRVAPRARWADEVIRDPRSYGRPASPDWVSGACMLVRRSAFEAAGGFDERFFLYCEDMDLCRAVRSVGHDVRYEPSATAHHIGGVSSAPGTTRPMLARSRILYARKHYHRGAVPLERLGVAVGEATHTLTSVRHPGRARAHALALRAALSPVGQVI